MMEKYQSQAKIFKALMHPARLAILSALRDGEQCVCHLESVLSCRQAYISQHLAILREAGLVEVRREGWNIFYGVARSEVFELMDAVASLVGVGEPLPLENAGCTCPKCNPAGVVVEEVQDGHRQSRKGYEFGE
jgi:DNA-binding transcriptional ArsR family regulator